MTKTAYTCRPKQSHGGWTAATLADRRTCRKNFFATIPEGFLSLGVPLTILEILRLAVANRRVGSFLVAPGTLSDMRHRGRSLRGRGLFNL